MRGFLRVLGRFLKILGRRERSKEEKRMQDAPYFLLCSPMLHMLDPYVPLFSNPNVGLLHFGEVFMDVSRIW